MLFICILFVCLLLFRYHLYCKMKPRQVRRSKLSAAVSFYLLVTGIITFYLCALS